MKVTNYLLGYKNLYIIQDSNMFNFSLDSVLLANFIKINSNVKEILDIGCGNAPIPLILTTKTNAHITGIEIQKEVYNLAQESIKLNKKDKQISLVNEDINDWYTKQEINKYDIIYSNPPYFRYLESSNINESKYKQIARHEIKLNINQLCNISKRLLKVNGILALVHRPERLADIIIEMRNNGIEPKRIQFIYPSKSSEANIVLIEGRKSGKPGIKILSPIYSHTKDGEYTDEVKKFFTD